MIPIVALPIAPIFTPVELIVKNRSAVVKSFLFKKEDDVYRIQKNMSAPQQVITGIALGLLFPDASTLFSFDDRLIQLWKNASQMLAQPESEEPSNTITKARKQLLEFTTDNQVIKNGVSIRNNVADYIFDLSDFNSIEDVVSFSRILDDEEVVVIYNTSTSEAKEKFIMIPNDANVSSTKLNVVYGYHSCLNILLSKRTIDQKCISYIRIYLHPLQLIILKK